MHLICSLICLGPLVGGADATAVGVEPYQPREGDIIFYHADGLQRLWGLIDWLAGTKPPDHCGIVVMLDGHPVVLEAAPDDGKIDGFRVLLLDAASRLPSFQGRIWVRRIREPLTAEQAERLRCFAAAQQGKRYALVRVALAITPLRCHGGVRAQLFGKTDLDRRHWICSELVLAAACAAGILDPHACKASALYPRDMFDNCGCDLNASYLPAVPWIPTVDGCPAAASTRNHP